MNLPLFAALQKSADMIRAVGTVTTALIIFLVVLYLAYLASKLVGKRYGGGASGKNLQILETLSLSPNQRLYIVRAADKTLLLAAAKDSVTCLSELDGEQLSAPAQAAEPLDFAKALKQAAEQKFGRHKPDSAEQSAKKGADDADA